MTWLGHAFQYLRRSDKESPFLYSEIFLSKQQIRKLHAPFEDHHQITPVHTYQPRSVALGIAVDCILAEVVDRNKKAEGVVEARTDSSIEIAEVSEYYRLLLPLRF